MKLKMDDAGNAVVEDGKPVYVGDDGKEIAFDAPGTLATISRLNGEARGHREAKEAVEAKLKAFDGIPDAEAARKALATVKNLDDKKLIEAGEVERIKAEVAKVYTDQIGELKKTNGELSGQIESMMIGSAFSNSKFIADKIAVPADLVRAQFGPRFKIEDGRVVAYANDGNKVYSMAPERAGEVANFDEAMEILVGQYPHRDQILKGNSQGGSGAGAGNGARGAKTISRAAFEQLDPAARAAAIYNDGLRVVD